jgi:hypothetical protein
MGLQRSALETSAVFGLEKSVALDADLLSKMAELTYQFGMRLHLPR